MAGKEIRSHVTGIVWVLEVEVGATVAEGDTVVMLESMKMEIPVVATGAGTVREILVAVDQAVSEGDVLLVLDPAGAGDG